MNKIILLFSLILVVAFADAQTSIVGTVTDENGEALTGANIYLKDTYDGTSSGIDGSFELISSETGTQAILVDFLGYTSYSAQLQLSGQTLSLSIQLKEAFNELTAVSVYASTFEAGDKKKSIALSSLDMLTTPSASGDVYGALQALPGTSTVGESGKLFVKGGDSRESKTFIDGTLVYVPYTASSPNQSVRSRFSPFMFSGTMFSTGGYSVEYGQALSSVLALKTNEFEVQDQLNISVLSVGADIAGTKSWDKASLTASVAYNNMGPYMSIVPQNNKYNKYPETLTSDVSFRLKTAKSGLLKVFASLSQSKLNIEQQSLYKPNETYDYDLTNNNAFVNASWAGELKENWILSTGLSYTNNTDKVKIDSIALNEYLFGSHAKAMISHRLSDKIKVKIGSEWYAKSIELSKSINQTQLSRQFKNNTFAGFAEGEIYTSNKLVTRVGVRLEYADYLNKSNFAPRILSAYKLSKNSQVSVSYGWFFQDPDDDIMLFTNSLDYERADHYTLNYTIESDKRVLRSELYYKDYKNLVKTNGIAPNTESVFNNNGYGSAYGFDLFWRDNETVKDGEYWISYSYINAKRNYLNYPNESVPSYVSKHNLTLVYKHWFGNMRSLVGGTFSYSSPRVYNNPNSSQFNGEQTKAYQSLDFNWSFLYRTNIIFYASVSNVLGYNQHYGYQYASVPNQDGVYANKAILPGAKRFYVLGCFITLSKKGNLNQLNKY